MADHCMLMGVETEYALSGYPDHEVLLYEMIGMARSTLTYLPGGGECDLYLENGQRLYVDNGGHPELTTPECSSPGELVRYVVAGERILANLLARLRPRLGERAARADEAAARPSRSPGSTSPLFDSTPPAATASAPDSNPPAASAREAPPPGALASLERAAAEGITQGLAAVRRRTARRRPAPPLSSRAPAPAQARRAAPCDPIIFKTNVDYGGARTTWGCHESYMHRANPSTLPPELIPHLVSRIIFAGAGGFNPLSPGLEFTLSPRAWHLRHAVSKESTHSRAIFHTKDEPLARPGYHRLHLICGESLCSQIASYLKVGTTALVLAAAEAGLRPGQAVQLARPVQALQTIAADPRCQATVRMNDGRALRAVDIQRHYLEFVEAHARDRCMPPWTAEVCREWRALLDRLEHRPESLAVTLDWAIKRALYERRAARRGIDWQTLPSWTYVVAGLQRALSESEHPGSASVELVLSGESPIPQAIEVLTPYLRQRSIRWEQLRPFMDLRQELFELEVRFGQLGEAGVFGALDRRGLLEHGAPGVGDIEAAVTEPPSVGRAALRGRCIREFAGRGGYHCEWQRISDYTGNRVLNLSDPFESRVRWKKLADSERLAEHLRRAVSSFL